MSELYRLKIDVTKIDKTRLFQGAKGTYLDLDVWINDQPDQYGNDCSVSHTPTKEERDAKAQKIYLGNGKCVFGDKAPREGGQKPGTANEKGWDKFDKEEEGSIPF